jgi:HJR/Mrr/RecB family endonuclease
MSSNVHYWKRDLEQFKIALEKIAYVPRYSREPQSFPRNTFKWIRYSHKSRQLSAEDVDNVLRCCAAPPHGAQLFVAADVPAIGLIPSEPYGLTSKQTVTPDPVDPSGFFAAIFSSPKTASKPVDIEELVARKLYFECQEQVKSVAQKLDRARIDDQRRLHTVQLGLNAGPNEAALKLLLEYSNHEHAMAECLRKPFRCWLDEPSRRFLIEIDVPNFDELSFVKEQKTKFKDVAKRESAFLRERLLYSLLIRACYLAVKSDEKHRFDVIAVNAHQSWRDKVTGRLLQGITASLQAARSDVEVLDIEHVDPKMCFSGLKGLRTPNIDDVTPIRPIFEFSTEDDRIVTAREIVANSDNQNLASMEWEDFEHLVRQLFEWEFGKNGAEVKITRASRDRGVDAIMFDPDPIRGGKYVIQAKRYTLTVGVDAVRDLYGTVINEGANRGILVATSSFGPDAYEFAKGKPISLVDGPNLLAMLRKHGQNYFIDLKAARNDMANTQRNYGKAGNTSHASDSPARGDGMSEPHVGERRDMDGSAGPQRSTDNEA